MNCGRADTITAARRSGSFAEGTPAPVAAKTADLFTGALRAKNQISSANMGLRCSFDGVPSTSTTSRRFHPGSESATETRHAPRIMFSALAFVLIPYCCVPDSGRRAGASFSGTWLVAPNANAGYKKTASLTIDHQHSRWTSACHPKTYRAHPSVYGFR